MHTNNPRIGVRLTLVALTLLAVSPGLVSGAMDGQTEEALLKLEAVLEMVELSEDLWPAWDVSDTPFALLSADSTCYLINHPRPPAHFERVREETPLRTTIYSSEEHTVIAGGACLLEGEPTAVLDIGGARLEMLPSAFDAAFRAHAEQVCEDAMEPIELLSGYPIDAWNLVLADIECRLLHRAALAPEDSLDLCVREFASVRRHRRLRMGERYAEFERRIEFTEGIPAYLAERCRREAAPYLGGRHGRRLEASLGEPGALERCLPESPGMDWYRGERFRWTGAVLCGVMDRYVPEWKEVSTIDCIDPYEVVWRRVRLSLPSARTVLNRFGYEERVARMTITIEESKTPAERMFEEIMRSGKQKFSVGTHLLSSGQVSFDPAQVERIDSHRQVCNGLLKVEYSGGTHFYATGIPVAVVLGEDEFDFRTLVIAAPEEFTIVIDGDELELLEGVHEFMHSLSVTAPGLSLEAASGTVMAGTGGVSFILHR